MLQSELQGEQQLEETERVPDNYPYRLPPLSGRKEHTQSIMRGSQRARKDTDIRAHSDLKEDTVVIYHLLSFSIVDFDRKGCKWVPTWIIL